MLKWQEMAFISVWWTKKTKSQHFYGGGITADLEAFKAIPIMPIAYWISEKIRRIFKEKPSLGRIAEPRQGLTTGDNNRFLKLWHEVYTTDIYFGATDYIQAMYTGKKWFPCHKGGAYRKWYGNNDYIINWQHNGKEIKDFSGSVIRNPQYYFNEGGTWSTLSSADLSMRYSYKGFIFESKGSMCFANNDAELKYIIGFMNSIVVKSLLKVLSPTLDYSPGPLGRLPVSIDYDIKDKVDTLVNQNISLCEEEWDEYETSWAFKKHPLI